MGKIGTGESLQEGRGCKGNSFQRILSLTCSQIKTISIHLKIRLL